MDECAVFNSNLHRTFPRECNAREALLALWATFRLVEAVSTDQVRLSRFVNYRKRSDDHSDHREEQVVAFGGLLDERELSHLQ